MKKYNYNSKKEKIQNKKLFVILLLVIIILTSIFSFSYLKEKGSFLVNLLEKPTIYLKNKLDLLKNNKYLIAENKKLKATNLELSYTLLLNEELAKEIEILKKELNLKNIYANYNLIHATVISRNKSYFFNELTIDKGKEDGINKDMAVVTNNGLVGKIIRVYKKNSIVKMITNDDSNNKISVSVEGKKENLNGIITGYDEINNYIEVTGITSYDDVEISSKVTTTGLGTFPKGIAIGEIKEIKKDNYNISKILYVEPFQDMNNISYVAVLGNTLND